MCGGLTGLLRSAHFLNVHEVDATPVFTRFEGERPQTTGQFQFEVIVAWAVFVNGVIFQSEACRLNAVHLDREFHEFVLGRSHADLE